MTSPLSTGPIYCLVTVDGDLRVGDAEQQAAAIAAMRALHARLGLAGRTTWFINALDFDWTGCHGAALLDLAATGETLGVHDHLDTYYVETEAQALALMKNSLLRLRQFFERVGRPVTLAAHRSGCFFQNEPAYRAARALGYTLLSDVRPGTAWHARMVRDQPEPSPWRCLGANDADALYADNRCVPLGTCPWRHDAYNWLDYTSRAGPFLQVPVTCAPWADRQRCAAAVESRPADAYLVCDTHPYDLQDPATGAVCPERLEHYAAGLDWLRAAFRPEFIRLDEVADCLAQRTPLPAG
jgi:hypothetical protein